MTTNFFFLAIPQEPIAWYCPAVSPTSPCLPTQQGSSKHRRLLLCAEQQPRGVSQGPKGAFQGCFLPAEVQGYQDLVPSSIQTQNWLPFSNSKPKASEKGRVGDGEGRKETTHLLLISLWCLKVLERFTSFRWYFRDKYFFAFLFLFRRMLSYL